MSMIPLALAAMLVKPLANPLINRLGYRRVLTTNTLLLGLLIASMALIDNDSSRIQLLVQLFLIGAVNSLQFTAMNAVTLIDLPDADASSGNGLLSVVAQLSMSFGVAAAAALLGGFTLDNEDSADGVLRAFHATYLCIGGLSMLAAALFLQLPRRGSRHRKKDIPDVDD